MIAKCPCEHCGVNIEFATEEFLSGSSVDCPHCGKETFLYASPQAKPAPKPAAPAEPPTQKITAPATSGQQKSNLNFLPWIIVAVLVVVIGFLAVNFSREHAHRILLEGKMKAQTAAKALKIDPQSQLKLLDTHLGYNYNRHGRVIIGSLENQSSVRFRRVRIIFNLMEGYNETGQAVATTFNLPAGETWYFETDQIGNSAKISGEPLIEGEVAQ
jgi:predicted  nucleic acid-binding Zn-ribbon protein